MTPAEGERNYHIFYQICVALDNDERAKLRLGKPDQYTILTLGDTITSDGLPSSLLFSRPRVVACSLSL